MRFEITQNTSDQTFAFQVLHDDGTPLLSSQAFSDREQCTEGIQAAIQALGNTSNFTIQDDNSLALQSEDGAIIAQSGPLSADQNAPDVIDSIVEDARNTPEFDVSFTTTTRRTTQLQVPKTLSLEEFAALYNFARLSISGSEGFELFQAEDNQEYYFHFNDHNGQALLYSRGFSTAGQRDRRLESVIKSAGRENRYEIIEQEGQFFFILKARNGQEIARSRMFASRPEAETAVAVVRDKAPSYSDQYIKKRTRRDTSGTDDYLLAVPSPTQMPGFDAFRNPETKRHYFHLNDNEGVPVLFSQGYTSGRGRDNGIRSVIKNSVNAASFIPAVEAGKYFFSIQAANRQEIARSRNFNSEEERDAMIAFLLTWIRQFASAYNVTIPTDTTSTETFTLAGFQPGTDDTVVQDDASSDDTIIAGLTPAIPLVDTSEGNSEDDATVGEDSQEETADESATSEGNSEDDATVSEDSQEETADESASDSGTGAVNEEVNSDASANEEDAEYEDAEHEDEETVAAGGDGAMREAEFADTSKKDAKKEEEEELAYADDDRGGFRLRLPWIIPLILLLLLLLFLMRGCFGCIDLPPQGLADSGDDDQEQVVDPDNTSASDAGIALQGSGSSGESEGEGEGVGEGVGEGDSNPATASAATGDVSGSSNNTDNDASSVTTLGPDARVLGFAPGTLEANIADFLSNPSRSLPETFVMDKVAFPVHSAKLNKSAYTQVDNLVKVLQAYPNIVFEFQGHIDGNEDENSAREFMNGENITLSAVRARCLVKKFEEQSIASSQLAYVGLGANQPVANNATEANRQKNRRLEILIREK